MSYTASEREARQTERRCRGKLLWVTTGATGIGLFSVPSLLPGLAETIGRVYVIIYGMVRNTAVVYIYIWSSTLYSEHK